MICGLPVWSTSRKGAPSLAATAYCRRTRLFSCLVPICGGDPIRITFGREFLADADPDIREIARLLSTAYLIDPDLAESLVGSLGGEPALFELFRSQIPWTTSPEIEPDGTHGRTVRSNWYHAAELHQPDPHETVCDIWRDIDRAISTFGCGSFGCCRSHGTNHCRR